MPPGQLWPTTLKRYARLIAEFALFRFNEGALTRGCGCDYGNQLRRSFVQVAKRKTARATARLDVGRNGKKKSFRHLKAFGIWADRDNVKDPVQFTDELRARMERGSDAR